MKVLILPAWYPNSKKKEGYFFKEQAVFLNENGFDVTILMVEELNTKYYYFQYFKRLLQRKSNKLTTIFLEQDPKAFSFPVIVQKSWSDEKKLRVMDKGYIKAFQKLTKKHNWHPEIIHLQGMYKYGMSSYLIAEKFNIPLVVIEHSPFRMQNYNNAQQKRIKRIFEVAKKIAGVSHFHKKSLSKVNVEKEVEVVWNFMDEQRFSLTNTKNTNNDFIVTTILRVSSVKGPITFFDAISKFIKICIINRPIEVHVVGLSSLKDLLLMKGIDEKFIAKYNHLQDFLKFHPWLDRDAIERFHQKSSVFVSTSIQETYGIAVREAMLCGVPVIATQSGGPEDSINKSTGLLVGIDDVENIAQKLLAIYNGDVYFNSNRLREYLISQSGRKAFLNRMKAFYKL